jgi:hypothetical protein
MVAYCQQVALATGSARFVIDRAVKAVALAGALDEQGVGWLCMLEDHEQAGRESVEATEVDLLEAGTRVESGPWKASRPNDPRRFVIVVPAAGTPLVSWGTPKVADALEASAWPRVSRERNEMHAHSFKGMIDHGGLDSHDGRQTIRGPDRHPQRTQEQLAPSLETAHQWVAKQAEAVKAPQDKGAESESKGQGKRLAQRTRHVVTLEPERKDAKAPHARRSAHASALGPTGPRAERDCRTQTSMTMRTRWREHRLRAFLGALVATLPTTGSVPQVFHLLFERSGARMKTPSQVVDWVNTAGVSLPNRRLLREIVEGLGAMDLQDQGTPIHVRIKDVPP